MNNLYELISEFMLKRIDNRISFFKEYNQIIKSDLRKDKLENKSYAANIRYALIKLNNIKLKKLYNQRSAVFNSVKLSIIYQNES